MAETRILIANLYAAFNRRDIDGALAWMSERVVWPRASEGRTVAGKEEIRAYWTRQWSEFDPSVEPLEVIDNAQGGIEVRVRQIVRSLQGALLSDTEVRHLYTISDGLIERMELAGGGGENSTPSAAFSRA